MPTKMPVAHEALPRSLSSGSIVVVLCAAIVSGCATNPLVSWQRPELNASPVELDAAQRYADAARTAYLEARRSQVQADVGLNSGLLGLGALGTGLALAKSHRDALLATAFIGGTAYAFGRQNLNVQYRLVYEAGIDAIGCAKEAVLPLAMSIHDRAQLETAMDSLGRAVSTAASARAEASAALAAWTATEPTTHDLENSAKASIAATGSAIDGATASITSGRLAIRGAHEAGDRLVAAVERIDSAVNKAITAQLPDTSSIFKVIAGLPGFAAGIVPGSDAAISAALAKSSATFKPVLPQSGDLTKDGKSRLPEAQSLFDRISALNKANDELKLALAQVSGRLPTEDSLKGFHALKDCGLGDVTFALKALPAAPTLTAGADRKTPFTISGGTAPYVVQLQVSPVKGVNLIPPAPFDSTAIFEISKDAEAGTVPVLVLDSSKPAKSLIVPVEILGGDTGDKKAGPTSGTLPPQDASALAKSINDKVIFKRNDGIELSVSNAATRKSDTQVDLGLSCKPKPPKCINAADAKQTVLAGVQAPASMAEMLKINPAAGCICPL